MSVTLAHARAAMLQKLEQHVALKAQELRNEIDSNFSRPGTGRVYSHYFRRVGGKLIIVGKRSAPHQASAPGEGPAIDTGRLSQSITAVMIKPGHWRVGTNVEYALWLEFGTKWFAPRPFVRPAVEKLRRSS